MRKFKANLPLYWWKFTHSAIKWVQDSDGDIGVRILWIMTLIKYKESTLVYWFKRFPASPKYVRGI